MCFHLCLTSFVWHNMFSAFCFFLNFLYLFLMILRSFPENKMSPLFITFIINIQTPWFSFLCCLWHLYFLFISIIWLLWVSAVVYGIEFPDQESNLGSYLVIVESQHQDHHGISGYSYFCLFSLLFLSFDFIMFQG